MTQQFYLSLKNSPMIAAVKNMENLDAALKSNSKIIFLLCGSISILKETIERCHQNGKIVFVHIDLIEGLGRDASAIKYLRNEFNPDGVISTKNQLLKAAAKENMLTVQRFFLLDSISMSQCLKISAESKPSAIEIMPGVMPEIIKEISDATSIPVIVGGLIRSSKDCENALKAGALGVSATKTELW